MNDDSRPSADLADEAALDEAVETVIARAERRLLIAAPRLVLDVFRRPSITDLLRPLIVGHEKNEIRILLSHEKRFLRENTYLTEYVRRHPSRITLKVTPDDLPLDDELVVIADSTHIMHQPDLAHPRGELQLGNRALAESLEGRVRAWWDRSGPPSELSVSGL